MDTELLRLSDLLAAAAPASGAPGPATPYRRPASRDARPASAAAAHQAPPPTAAAVHEVSSVQLHSSLAKELSALDALFARWQADVAAKQRAAARDFPDDRSFAMAVVEWYFAPRHASSPAGELACTRCCLHIARRQTYWVDRAASTWTQADELCRRCLLCVMRGLLGEDDAAILSEAQSIMDSAWSPTFNAALVDALGGRAPCSPTSERKEDGLKLPAAGGLGASQQHSGGLAAVPGDSRSLLADP